MTQTSPDTASVVERTRQYPADGVVVGAHFLGSTAVFVLGEEALLLVRHGEASRVAIHGGAVLASAADGERVVTGGDDGRIVATDAAGSATDVATDPKRRWIDHVAIAPNGAVAWSAGKQAFARAAKDAEHVFEAPSTVGALAFAPKGFRLAIAHYNGATLWFPNAERAAPETLAWKGSHLAATFSPDGRFLITAMQEPTLHGWRLADRKDMRMQGYAARVRSLDWTADGKWLASSGAAQLVLWPFQSKSGPMGKTPQVLAPGAAPIDMVACHPSQAVVAVGYADGLVLLIRLSDGAEILARKPAAAPVTALAWNESGTLLAFGTEDGDAGIVDLG
ncbi:MAG TPA: WD40 repeat domain-containing protein [Xanthobacteraceae bacterium]